MSILRSSMMVNNPPDSVAFKQRTLIFIMASVAAGLLIGVLTLVALRASAVG